MCATHCTQRGEPSSENQIPDSSIIGQVSTLRSPPTSSSLAKRAAGKDAIVCSLTDRIDAALIGACPDLKVVANIAVGYNNIDVPACTARGVLATNTPGVLDDSTADLAWTLMLGAVDLLLLPYGTALGVYTIWVLLHEDGKRLFAVHG